MKFKKNPIFLSLIMLILLGVIMIIFNNISNLIGGTNPEEILNYTHGEITHTPKIYLNFEEYYDLHVPKPERIRGSKNDVNLALEVPKLEFDYLQDYELDYCESKKLDINFTNTEYSDFTFNYKNYEFNYKINLYKDIYQFSSELKKQDCYYDYDEYENKYLKDPYNNVFTDALSRDFIQQLREEGFSDDEILEIATVFIQSINYGTDYTELNRYPYETIYEKEGNCFDKSIILAGIIKNLGYEVSIVLGYVEEEYHAIVAVVCEEGNLIYNSKNICFIETTSFHPIGSEMDLDIDRYIKVSEEGKSYDEVNYGKNHAKIMEDKIKEADELLIKIDSKYDDLLEINEKMCNTDCLACYGENAISVRWCTDAPKYNKLIEQYNEIITSYNPLIKDYYEKYYYFERLSFDNLRLVERTEYNIDEIDFSWPSLPVSYSIFNCDVSRKNRINYFVDFLEEQTGYDLYKYEENKKTQINFNCTYYEGNYDEKHLDPPFTLTPNALPEYIFENEEIKEVRINLYKNRYFGYELHELLHGIGLINHYGKFMEQSLFDMNSIEFENIKNDTEAINKIKEIYGLE